MSLSPTNSLRILVLDGGGVKDYTSLLILKRIFRTIQDKGNLDEEPRACDVFDLIVGSSTRGLIAVMLGLLSMTIPDAIHQYEALGQRVFGKKVLGGVVGIAMKGIASHPLYDIATLQGCINDVLKDLRPPIPPDSPFCEVDNPRCKVMLCVTRQRVSRPDVLRNYNTTDPTQENYICRIWEAASATAAALIYFKGVKFLSRGERWVDGGPRRNNPIHGAMAELLRVKQFKDRDIGCVVSIGAGVPDIKPTSSDLLGFLKGAVDMMTDSEQIADDFTKSDMGMRLGTSRRYFQFNHPWHARLEARRLA